jgi:hypothetical protein
MNILIKNIIGLWDLEQADPSLGAFLIFQEELLLQREILQANSIEILFCLNKNLLAPPYLATLALFNPFLESAHFVNDDSSKANISDNIDTTFYWPTPDMYQHYSYSGSTLAVQKLWQKTGKLINLKSPDSIHKQAQEWINKYVGSYIPIVVHLKNSSTDTQSNANQESWIKLFKDCEDKELPVRFVLIGNDTYDTRLLNCSNVVLTKTNGGCIELDLSLISMSLLFMGMASGPCNMALFSGVPYLIWKHPHHHAKEMEREFQGHSQFIFANENQKFMREWDTADSLIREFKALYARLNKQQWFANMNKGHSR